MAATAPSTTANGRQYRRISSTITRPNDTNAYVSGDLVADNTVAASVTPMSWLTTSSRPLYVPKIRLHKTGAAGSIVFRAYIFATSPTVSTAGDNGVFKDNVNNAANCMAIYEGTVYGFKDGAVGFLVPIMGVISKDYVGDATTIYGLAEARSAWTPIANEVLTFTLNMEFDQ